MNPLFPLLFQTNRQLAYELNNALKPFQLHHAQWSVIHILYRHGELPLTAIWKMLLVEAPTVTRTVTRLQQLGYVTHRQGEDKREKIVALTPFAVAQIPAILQQIARFEEQMAHNLTSEEQQQLVALLTKMRS